MKCSHCAGEIQVDAAYCTNCGSAVNPLKTVNAIPQSHPVNNDTPVYENAVLMKMARESLNGKWGLAAVTFLVYFLISGVIQFIPFLGYIASFLISGPLSLGIAVFCLAVSRNREAKLDMLFEGFQNFGNALGAYILMLIFVLLWMILLLIPGIIAAFSYSMTYYIMADDSSIGIMEAIDKSKKMMSGYKWKLFCLYLRFIGWIILSALTFGIGLLWVVPYMQVSSSKFYDNIKDRSVTE